MYSDKQYALLEKLEDGLVWEWHMDRDADEVLRFLMNEGIITPREDLKHGLLKLTQKGSAVLSEHRAELENLKKQADEKLQDKIEKKAEKKREHIFQIFLTVFGFVLGVIADNIMNIGDWVIGLFRG